MGWQQFLNNSSVPLKQRLHGAHVAFLASSSELTTQQKEDVVILWLTRLVKEKQMSAWQEDTDLEQEQVWWLLDQLFSSQRLQQLVSKAWTCPITSAFPQSIIDVLGAPALGAETRRLVESTACSIISTPALASVITNSMTLSLQVTTALLDAAIGAGWPQAEAERLKQLAAEMDESNPNEARQTSKKTKFQWQSKKDQGAVDLAVLQGLLHEEKILKALSIILDDITSQLLVKNDDSAVKFCCQQLLKRMVSFELSAEAYKGHMKMVLLRKMERLIKESLFNSNVVAQYSAFMSFLHVEDCKVFSEVSLIPVVLSSISAFMSSESQRAASRTVSLFFEGFLARFPEDEHRVKMLACLLHIAGVTLLGDVISCDSEASQFIERMPIDARAQESILVALIKPLQNLDRIAQGSRLNTYLVLLLRHLTAQQPLSSDWFVAMQGLLMLLPDDHAEELQTSLGEMLTTAKPDEQSLDIVSDLLNDLLQHHINTTGPIAFVSGLMQSIIAKKDKLKSHREIIPFTLSSDHTNLRLLLPPQFLGSLSLVLGRAQPLVFCDLLSALLTCARDLLLPLFSAADESSGRALTGCCWVLSAVLGGACAARVVAVQHFAADMMHCVTSWAQQLMDPLLQLLADQPKPDPLHCCGALLLSHAFSSFVQELLCCDTFTLVWQESSHPFPPSLVPLTNPRTWASLVTSIEACTDVTTRCLMLRLVLMRLQHLHVEGKRAAAHELYVSKNKAILSRNPASSPSKPHHAPPSQATEAREELKAFLCKTFKTMLENSCAKVSLKLVRDLLCDNLFSSVHAVPSCHKAVVRNVLNAYLTSPKLVQRTILGLANFATLVPQMVQSALVMLASTLKLDKSPEGVGKKRKWGSGDAPREDVKGNLHVKGKKQKRENGESSERINEEEDNSAKQKISEEIVENEISSHDHLRAILTTVNVRLYCLEEGDDKKRIYRDSAKTKLHLEHITEVVNKGLDEAPIQYNDHDTAANICNFFLDIKLSALSEPQIVAVLQSFMALFLLSDIKEKKQKKIILALLRCTNVCFQALRSNVGIISTKQLPALVTRLISLRCCSSSVFAASKVNSDSNLVVSFDTMLNFVLHQLVQFRGELDVVTPVADALVQSAEAAAATRAAYTTRAAVEERHLLTAWQLVCHCAHVMKDKPSPQCRAAVRTLALWCMSTGAASAPAPPPDSVLYILAMYSELLSLEQVRPGTQEGKGAPHPSRHLENGISAHCGNLENGTHDSDANASENIKFDEKAGSRNEELNYTQHTENNADTNEEGKVKYSEHLTTAWRLAQFCVSSNSALLHSCALQFFMHLKRLLPHLRPQCPDVDISNSFVAFLQTQMSDAPSGQGAELLLHSVESFNITNSMIKKSGFITSLDQSTLNKQPLTEFLLDCPLEMYQSLLEGLLKRSLSLDDFLAPRTLGLWQLFIGVNVGSTQGLKAKRAALRTLTQVLVTHLKSLPSSTSSCVEETPGLSANAMTSVLETLTLVVKLPVSLPHQTVMQVLSAAAVPTCHLSLPHFALVWQKQVTLLSTALVSRTGAWPDRVSGLLSALLTLITALAQRSSAFNCHAHTHKEVLTSCCLSMEQLLRKLHPLRRDLHHVLHLTAGSIISALQQHNVIPPVRSVLDAEIYKLLKMCSPTGLDHLAVALPAETRPLFHHYRNNFKKYYAVNHSKE